MAVNQKMRAAGRTLEKGPRQNNWIALGRAEAGMEPQCGTVPLNPLRTMTKVFLMLRLGGDAWEPDIVAQFANKAGLIVFEIIQHFLHGCFVTFANQRCKDYYPP